MPTYRNQQIVIHFDPNACIHAEECVRGLPAVFDVAKDPWINVDGAPAETIAEVVGRCPSGALRCERVAMQ